ncbi:hypothetical protein [Noviherbaspirillum denitrificans]|uniref:Uncharacterized protein n=1 Tax=Noviherbaspirillum denitrificans TaxID=1968433 RepID=A0A254T9R2_9BURK|nr:hypothetical protein [Noviherbaspirillum denitrificans]OWW18400.1 hypothetical protein AYR66_00950 [Noviherbaspirillum denitrificans]OWW19364.1 hypothetical protein AYR66_07435 [Noviherbaspirillum denitrificans]
MEWKSIVSAVAPWIGTALGGPLGGMAVSAIADAFGLPDKTEAALKQALSGATPEQMLALKKADSEFAVRMQELGFQNVQALEKIAADDRASARTMQMTTSSRIPGALAILITVGFFGILLGMMSGMLKTSENQALLIMLGALGAAWGAVVNFYYGSSSDSQNKTRMLAQGSGAR